MIARTLAGIVGAGILGCVAHASVMATGGYGTPSAPMILALAAGLAVGAACVGIAWTQRRIGLALLLALGLVAGEAYALLMTAERTLAHREAQQAPMRAAVTQRAQAATRVGTAERAVVGILDTPRLKAAIATKAAADAAAVSKSAERGCASNCRALLQAQVDAAAAELDRARQDLERIKAAALAELTTARAALAAIPAPPSASPLADRLGLEGWQIDLAAAALASLAANGLGAFLLAFAAHGAHRPERIMILEAPARANGPVDRAPVATRAASIEADAFARSTFQPAATGRVKISDIRADYHTWCAGQGIEPLSDRAIGMALNDLFQAAGLDRDGDGAEAAIVGITRRPASTAIARAA